MESCFSTYNGWQMSVTVEQRPDDTGKVWYYILPPVTYREFATDAPRQHEMGTHTVGRFRDIDRAFSAAFSDCAREIDREIDARARRGDRWSLQPIRHHQDTAMNKPYINMEAILDMFHEIARNAGNASSTADSLNWLAEFLAREHTTMNTPDWNGLVHVGAALYLAQHSAKGIQQTGSEPAASES